MEQHAREQKRNRMAAGWSERAEKVEAEAEVVRRAMGRL